MLLFVDIFLGWVDGFLERTSLYFILEKYYQVMLYSKQINPEFSTPPPKTRMAVTLKTPQPTPTTIHFTFSPSS